MVAVKTDRRWTEHGSSEKDVPRTSTALGGLLAPTLSNMNLVVCKINSKVTKAQNTGYEQQTGTPFSNVLKC